jgi:hypothetical protein
MSHRIMDSARRMFRVTVPLIAALTVMAALPQAASAGDSAAKAAREYSQLRTELEMMLSAKGIPMPEPGGEMQFKRTDGNGITFIECIGSVGQAVHRGAFGAFPPLAGVQVSAIIVCTQQVRRIVLGVLLAYRTFENPTVNPIVSSYFEIGGDNRLSMDASSILAPCHNWQFYIGLAGGEVTFPDGAVLTAEGSGPNYTAFGDCLS